MARRKKIEKPAESIYVGTLQYSPTGIPYIKFDESGRNRIAFCRFTATSTGYTNFIVKADIIEKQMNKKTHRVTYSHTQTMQLYDLDLKGLQNIINKTNKFMNRRVLNTIAGFVNKYVVGTEFPFDKIDALSRDLDTFNMSQ